MPDAYVLHRILRRIAGAAVVSFYNQIHVIGGENVPEDGPIIVAATHHNMMLDPAVLSSAFPTQRILHYWSKASLFANPVAAYILLSSGNIPVARKSSDRRVLFQGTFDALEKGEIVALFPEGTSYTEPRIMQVKDGAAWAALEYTKYMMEKSSASNGKGTKKDVKIIPVAITYTNKSKYRSDVIMEVGKPLALTPYLPQFLAEPSEGGDPRAAVKRLTRDVERGLVQGTINAGDWDTLYAARMARDMLWDKERSINLDDFVAISQTLVDLLSTPLPSLSSTKRHLLAYHSLLSSTNLSHSSLSSLPLPHTLSPNSPAPLPSRLYALMVLVGEFLKAAVRFPWFVGPVLVHAPVYIMGRLGARLVEEEEETQAQNKVVFGLLLLLMIYPAAFAFLWGLFWYTRVGALVAAVIVWGFANYHNKLINDNYEHAKRVVAAWRVLVGVWVPKKWDLSLSALTQYTTPRIPPENPWIDRPKKSDSGTSSSSPTPNGTANATASGSGASGPAKPASASGSGQKRRRPPSRRLIRHVLRARIEAARALSSFFQQLEASASSSPSTTSNEGWVRASAHLVKIYGGRLDNPSPTPSAFSSTVHLGNGGPVATPEGVLTEKGATGWRSTREVLQFLRSRGAKIGGLEKGFEGEWAAFSSGELSSPGEESDYALVEGEGDVSWVPSGAD
ncbi:hypothetical protein JAAARDRAFT_195538 [Jaapia argillacea MUCL 33604]|uniref:Phospholipid/glycerol acyltransferase domain-containing protein n=1 Tax=Jaapia argillacea MUCL 33604 TaxID=933084 RepID=A0A067PWQ4_9AGAM|nr:hypothetical protein JAAARDRAFT_195538 [Jaapia argillacea MUCL 33604]